MSWFKQGRGLLSLVFLGIFPSLSLGQSIAALDSACREALEQWQVPGLAVAIVKDNRVIYLKGFGVKKLGSPDSIGPDTLFPLASCSKTITSQLLATLVDEGKLHWDDQVRKHVPFFKLGDPLADANVTLRDLLCHRTGVGGHDLLWYWAPWKQEERIKKIGHLELQNPFRGRFQYQTILFGTTGLAAGNATGSTWQQLVEKKVFQPLGMKNTRPTAPPLAEFSDQPSPHRRNRKGQIEGVPRYPLEEPDPAGSIHTTARDLTRFLRFQLGDGTWEGKRLVSSENLKETHSPHMVVRREGYARIMNPDTMQISYGLGWILQDYRAKLLLLHGGAIDGFRAQITLVPQENVGIALLNNLDRTYMNVALTQSLLDLILGNNPKDWNAYYLQVRQDEETQEKQRHHYFISKRQPDSKPTQPLTTFTGAYHDPAYGTGKMILEKNRLVWQWNTFRWPLEHYAQDTFFISNEVVRDAPVDFQVNAKGEVESFRFLNRVFQRGK
jgi:CubicO group peptidase (beta-lactamase class C family)